MFVVEACKRRNALLASDPNLNDNLLFCPIFETLPLTKDLKLVEFDITTADAGDLENLVYFTDVVKEV